MSLFNLGWNDRFQAEFTSRFGPDFIPARISMEQRGLYRILTDLGEYQAVPTGRLLYGADNRSDLPVVGDWVAVQIIGENDPTVTIHGVLARRSCLARQEAGRLTQAQTLASNIDTLFLMVGLDGNFKLNRIERFLAVGLESGAVPIVILTKADLVDDPASAVSEVGVRCRNATVHAISAATGYGLDAIDMYLTPGSTIAMLGSSGVGKSTLLNYLMGVSVQPVQEVRDFDSRGRHTTTHRQMFLLRSGALLIDTPGIREFQMWDAGDGVSEAFEDIAQLALECRFADCSHVHEPGCAVRDAIENGSLDKDRLEHFRKLSREVAYQHRKTDVRAQIEETRKWKKISKLSKEYKKH